MKISFLLITIISFILYGVVGKDKTWLMAPILSLNYCLILGWLISRFLKKSPVNLSIDIVFWLIFFLYSIVITTTSSIIYESKLEVIFFGAILGSFLFWRSELISFKKNKTYFHILLLSVLLCAIYGIIIHFKFPEQVLWADRYTEAYEGRLRSTYICPNHFAHLIQMILPFLFCYLFIKRKMLSLKLLSIYSIIIFIPTLFFTESRAGWLGGILSLSVLVCLFALKKSKRLFSFILFATPLTAILILLFSWNYSETFQRRMAPVVEFLQGQVEGGIGSESKDFRPQTWSDTINMIKDKPIIGHGPGSYNYTFPPYRETFKGERIITGHPHNEYLELISDYGLVGFLLFSIGWITTLVLLIRNSLMSIDNKHKFIGFAGISMIAGTMVHSFFDFQMHIYPNAMVFAFLIAISLSPQELSNNNIKNSKKNNKYFLSILFIIYFIGLIFCIQSMTSSFYRASSELKFTPLASNNNQSLSLINQSIKIDPSNWRAYKQLGKIESNNRYYNLSEKEKLIIAKIELDHYNRAYKYNSYDPEIFFGIGKALIFIGKNSDNQLLINEGLEWLYKGCSFRKFNNIYWWALGTELRKNKKYNEALNIFRMTNKKELNESIKANIRWLERKIKYDQIINSEKLNKTPNYLSNENKKSLLDILKEKTKIEK